MKKFFVIGLVLSLGCERYVEVDSSPIAPVQRDYMLVFIVDTSGSFSHRMQSGDGVGFRFVLRASDEFFRNRMGKGDRILISQLSAANRPLLWEDAPLSLRRRFGSSGSLWQFIEQRSDPSGSHVYAALANTLNYLLELPGVSEGQTEVCVLVLSDMVDNSPTQQQDKEQMLHGLEQFGQAGGCMGLYWVDQSCLSECRQWLADAGIQDGVVEPDFVDEPSLPSFE